jgi:uncharacterized protein (DUF1684 family)
MNASRRRNGWNVMVIVVARFYPPFARLGRSGRRLLRFAPMRHRRTCGLVLVCAVAGCARAPWPSPPTVDAAAYEREHQEWLAGERAYLSEVLPITGIWPLEDGTTTFGSDAAHPIVLAGAQVPARAGVFRRAGSTVTVAPEPGATLLQDDGTRLASEAPVRAVLAGPFKLEITDAGDDRRWVTVTDTTHPAVTNPPPLPSYPLDSQWRLAARFDAFDTPTRIRVPDVRGGTMEFTAVGELVFRVRDEERRLTAIGGEGEDRYAVWFKDETNRSTTYGGYRVVRPKVVNDGDWTVLDFNYTYNPPCAYSQFTACPLPPPENRLPLAVEAGLKRLPSAVGY